MPMLGMWDGGGVVCETCSDGLISFWKLDESSGNAIDSHGTNDGTVNGATQGAAGRVGTAYSFDGNDYVDVGTLGNYGTDLDEKFWTMAMWVKTTTDGVRMCLFGNNEGTTFQIKFLINTDDDIGTLRVGRFVMVRKDNDNNIRTLAYTSDSGITDGEWHHIVWMLSKNSGQIFFDGVELSLSTISFGLADDMRNPTNSVLAGAINNNGSPALYFTGSLDELGLWDRALTQAEVDALVELWRP